MAALLDVQNITKKYGDKTAVDSLTFSIEEGRCIALLGPNGAGKTTTLNMLAGLLQPTAGRIAFQGLQGDIRSGIGYLPQYPAFPGWMTGKEFIVFAGRLADLSAKEAAKRTDTMLELVGLQDARNRRIGGYSGGMKQRLGLAQAMVHKPKLVILDEPVSALDPIGRREVLDMMRSLKRNTTILFSTHVLHDAEEISDDVLIIRDGSLAVHGPLQAVKQQYRQSVLLIQTEEDGIAWLERLSEWPFTEEIAFENRLTVKLAVSNLEQAKLELLQDIVSKRIPLVRFQEAQSTLEDLFMKVVRK